MEKKFALVCTNEAHEVVSIGFYGSKEDAHRRMESEYISECDEFSEMDMESDISEDTARCTFSDVDYGYYWQIVDMVL